MLFNLSCAYKESTISSPKKIFSKCCIFKQFTSSKNSLRSEQHLLATYLLLYTQYIHWVLKFSSRTIKLKNPLFLFETIIEFEITRWRSPGASEMCYTGPSRTILKKRWTRKEKRARKKRGRKNFLAEAFLASRNLNFHPDVLVAGPWLCYRSGEHKTGRRFFVPDLRLFLNRSYSSLWPKFSFYTQLLGTTSTALQLTQMSCVVLAALRLTYES